MKGERWKLQGLPSVKALKETNIFQIHSPKFIPVTDFSLMAIDTIYGGGAQVLH